MEITSEFVKTFFSRLIGKLLRKNLGLRSGLLEIRDFTVEEVGDKVIINTRVTIEANKSDIASILKYV